MNIYVKEFKNVLLVKKCYKYLIVKYGLVSLHQ